MFDFIIKNNIYIYIIKINWKFIYFFKLFNLYIIKENKLNKFEECWFIEFKFIFLFSSFFFSFFLFLFSIFSLTFKFRLNFCYKKKLYCSKVSIIAWTSPFPIWSNWNNFTNWGWRHFYIFACLAAFRTIPINFGPLALLWAWVRPWA